MATKQQHSAWRVTLTVLLGMVIFTACPSEGNARGSQEEMRVTEVDNTGIFGSIDGLSEALQKRILSDYRNLSHGIHISFPSFNDFLFISGYFGTYNGYVMVAISPNVDLSDYWVPTVVMPPTIIADWYFLELFHHEVILAWRNGRFYRVPDLYRDGKLTLEDWRSIANHHPRWVPGR